MADSKNIQFTSEHRPALASGDYTIRIKQKVYNSEIDASFQSNDGVAQPISVLGPRFLFEPNEVVSVFPPKGSLGEHSNVLPHVTLRRSTLPWERYCDVANESGPWLALLIFNEEESKQLESETLTLSELKNDTVSFPPFLDHKIEDASSPYLLNEFGDHDSDSALVLKLNIDWVDKILPTKKELTLLTHVRTAADDPGSETDTAVIVSNRLPVAGETSIAHLVSLEGRYIGDNFSKPTSGDSVRLVSHYSWRFSCIAEAHSFKGLLMHLNRGTLRLPPSEESHAEKYLSQGAIPVPHEIRQGNQSVSWYRGPLLPGSQDASPLTFPIRTSDELMSYDADIGMFDVSLSSAWELGRMLALENKGVSVSLFHWKRKHARQMKRAEQVLTHLPFDADSLDLDLPDNVKTWFNDLRELRGIPFHYLVASEGMLPVESIRFFQVDTRWIEALLDGAFSVGRVGAQDKTNGHQIQSHAMSGFLLRSELVEGWPHLLVDGFSGNTKQRLIRSESYGKNIKLYLFEGNIDRVDIHQKPEALHFGVNRPDDAHATYYKVARDEQGEESTGEDMTVSFREDNKRVIKIETLGNGLTPAQFAIRLIEGVEQVSFQAN